MDVQEIRNIVSSDVADKFAILLWDEISEDKRYLHFSLSGYISRLISFLSDETLMQALNEKGEIDKIKLMELEIEYEIFVFQPDIYDAWVEGFYGQRFLHDKQWLKEELKEREQLVKEAFGRY